MEFKRLGSAALVFDLADRFYVAAEDPAALPEALTALALATGGHHAVAADQRRADGGWSATTGNVDPALGQRLLGTLEDGPVRRWLGRFPRHGWERMCAIVPIGTPLSAALYDSAFYSDFVRPMGAHHAALTSLDVGEDRSFLSVFRPDRLGDYEPEAMDVLEAVRPHVARALRLSRRLAAVEAGARAAFGMFDRMRTPVILFDGGLQLVFANRAATALANGTDALTLDETGLRLVDAAAARQFQLLLSEAALSRPPERSLRLRVARPESPYPLLLHLERLETPGLRAAGACVGVFIDDPGTQLAVDTSSLSDAFGLTAREAALTATLVGGSAPREAAWELGMSEATAKTHLKRIMDKVGAHRQAELVSLAGALARP